jgi:hypothetical protein
VAVVEVLVAPVNLARFRQDPTRPVSAETAVRAVTAEMAV